MMTELSKMEKKILSDYKTYLLWGNGIGAYTTLDIQRISSTTFNNAKKIHFALLKEGLLLPALPGEKHSRSNLKKLDEIYKDELLKEKNAIKKMEQMILSQRLFANICDIRFARQDMKNGSLLCEYFDNGVRLKSLDFRKREDLLLNHVLRAIKEHTTISDLSISTDGDFVKLVIKNQIAIKSYISDLGISGALFELLSTVAVSLNKVDSEFRKKFDY